MKAKFSPRIFAMTCGLILSANTLVAQTPIQLFSPLNVSTSLSNASFSTPYAFNTTTLNLSCPTPTSSAPIEAILSGPGPSGNLLVDNDILVTVTPANSAAVGPVNVCPSFITSGGEGLYTNNCFEGTYQGAAPGLIGQDPDNFAAASGYGVPEIDLGNSLPGAQNLLVAGPQSVTIALTDQGGEYTSTTLSLTTNCTQGPVTGPAQVTGNTINSGASPTGLTQTFTFNAGTGQMVGLVYNVGAANTANSITANGNGSSPISGDLPVDPSLFQTTYVPETSFATSNCLLHTGEALPTGGKACKLYTLECTQGNSAPSGANCPVSKLPNEVIQDLFDGPQFTLQNIYTPFGVFQEGIGFLMSADGWASQSETNPTGLPGGPCEFSEASGLDALPCPQNLLVSFSGPGAFAAQALTTNPNSTFISIYGVPEDQTSVLVAGEWPDNWVNTLKPKVYFLAQAPNFTKGASILSGNKLIPLPNASSYIPAPIQNITYGVSPAGSAPSPINEPIAGDRQLINPQVASGCPVPTSTAAPGPTTEPNFVPAPVTLNFTEDGQYLLHYYAQDCAGTQELQFTLNPANSLNPAPYWTTSFYTYPINVDTTPPVVTFSSPALSPVLAAGKSYTVGEAVTASYACSDATTGSGVVLCGTSIYAPGSNYSTGTLKAKVDTSSAGTKTFTVYAIDGAGNISSQSVSYPVIR